MVFLSYIVKKKMTINVVLYERWFTQIKDRFLGLYYKERWSFWSIFMSYITKKKLTLNVVFFHQKF
jgi:hypothetical protein